MQGNFSPAPCVGGGRDGVKSDSFSKQREAEQIIMVSAADIRTHRQAFVHLFHLSWVIVELKEKVDAQKSNFTAAQYCLKKFHCQIFYSSCCRA